MKKISAIIAVSAVAAALAFAGCQKQEAPKPAAEHSTMTSTVTSTTAPMAAPEHK